MSTTTSSSVQRTHGTALRGMDLVPGSFFTDGRFGRMFRNLPRPEGPPDQLAALAATMIAQPERRDIDPVPTPEPANEHENPIIPAGYTYLGQFVDHDITFDPVSSLQRQNDPQGLQDFRTPGLDLDSLYGRGPADQPYLYRNGPKPDPHPALGFDQRGVMMLVGAIPRDGDGASSDADLPRNSDGRALIGDPRNDENLVVSQLHLAFTHFHNRIVEEVFRENGLTASALFEEAQRRVRWHYQWVVVHDFLRRVVDGDTGDDSTRGRGVVDDVLRTRSYVASGGTTGTTSRPALQFYHWRRRPFIPVEFSVAAYRFGHTMVRPSYFINDFVAEQMANARIPILSQSDAPLDNLNGFRPLPNAWTFDWRLFFDLEPAVRSQRSYRIDTEISAPLGALPTHPEMPSLAHRNLLRGLRLGVPSGESVARTMGIDPLSPSELDLSGRGAPGFEGAAPLWYYVLREAELLAGAEHLGPVGGRIIAEVLIGLLAADPFSWLNVDPGWTPPLTREGRFGMPELISFAFRDASGAPPPSPVRGGVLDRWRAAFHSSPPASADGESSSLERWRAAFGGG